MCPEGLDDIESLKKFLKIVHMCYDQILIFLESFEVVCNFRHDK